MADTDTADVGSTPGIDMVKLKRFAELKRLLDDANNTVKKLKAEYDGLEPVLRDQFAQSGQQSASIDGVTVYLARETWANAVRNGDAPDWATSCEALKAAGYGAVVDERFNVQTVSAIVREFPKDENFNPILPPELVGKLNITSTFALRTRKAAGA